MNKIEELFFKKTHKFESEFLKLIKKSCGGDKIEDLYEYYQKGIYGGRFSLYDFYDDFSFLNHLNKNIKNEYILLYGLYQFFRYTNGLEETSSRVSVITYLSFNFFLGDDENDQLIPEFHYIINKNKVDSIDLGYNKVGKNSVYQNYIIGILDKLGLINLFYIQTFTSEDGCLEVLLDFKENRGKKISLYNLNIKTKSCKDSESEEIG